MQTKLKELHIAAVLQISVEFELWYVKNIHSYRADKTHSNVDIQRILLKI